MLLDHLGKLFQFLNNTTQNIDDKELIKFFDEMTNNIENLKNLKEMKFTLKGMWKILGELGTLTEVLSISVALYILIENVKKFSKLKKLKKKNTQFKEMEIFFNKFNHNHSMIFTNLDRFLKEMGTLLNEQHLGTYFNLAVNKLEYCFPVKFEVCFKKIVLKTQLIQFILSIFSFCRILNP